MMAWRSTHLAVLVEVVALGVGAMQPTCANEPPTVPAAIQAIPGTGAVLITYTTALNAVGYNIYRHVVGHPPPINPVNAQPDPYTWFIDDDGGKGLPNGTPYLYLVRPVFKDASGKTSEGASSSEVVVTPQVPILGGFLAYDIGTTDPSTVTLDGTVLTVKAAGRELWDFIDSGTFVGTAMTGDYSITAKVLAKPTGGHPWSAKAGVMIREGLVPGDRYAILYLSSGRGVLFEGRLNILGTEPGSFYEQGTSNAASSPPVWLRLTKSSATITSLQSKDGTNYTQVGHAHRFGRMEPVTYVGLGISAVNTGDPLIRYVTTKFDVGSIQITQP